MSIQRWECYDNHEIGKDDEGDYVTYDDHVAAVAAARADERERAAERVEALPVRQLDYWEVVARGHVLAAIDGVKP